MSYQEAKDRKLMPYKTLLEENQALLAENSALKDEIQNLRARLDEAEELERAISEGDLDALVIPGPEGELIFTLDSADRAYRVLVETMNEGTATLGFDGTILYCNRRLAELLKMPLPDITGTSIYRFIAPEDVKIFKALLKRKMVSGEVKLRAMGGKALLVYLSVSSLQTKNSPNAWCIVVTDLTEQKKNGEIVAAERLARSIIEQSTETIVVCDTSGRIIRFSDSMLSRFGFVPPSQRFEDVINLRFLEGMNAGKIILPVSSALRGLTITGAEAVFESRDCQRRFHLLLNSGPLNNSEGEIIGCVINLTDITQLKQTEEKLKVAYEELQTQSEEMVAQAEELRIVNEVLSESEKRFELLSEANALLLSSKDPESMIKTIAEKVMHHLNCDVFFNYVYDEIKGKLHLNAYAGISAEAAKEIEWMDKEDGVAICSCVARDDCRIIAQNLQHNRDKRADLVQLRRIQAYACQPLHIWEKTIGTLSFGTKSRNDFTEEELALMSTVADQVSVSIERKRAEKALQKSEERFRALVMASSEAVYSMSPDWSEMNQLSGRGFLANTESSNPTWLQEYILPEDQPYVTAVINEAIRTKSIFELEHRVRRVDSSLGWTFSRAIPLLDENGEIVEWFGAASDITWRKQAEQKLFDANQRLEALMNALPVGVSFSNDLACQSITGNPVALTQFEVGKEDNLSASALDYSAPGRQVRYLRDGRQISYTELPLQQAATENRKIPPVELEIELPSGRRWFAEASGAPIRNMNGDVVGGVAVTVDVTKRKQEEQRINRYNNVLEGINRIFGSVVKAETEEELVNLCLSVALEVTGGGIGFVAEVGVDGLLHDIAISDMGWKQCLMHDKTGHRLPPGNFVIHGLYGHVVNSGKSFFTNDPHTHPYSIGLPQSHPPLTSFLGVPLISNGKIMGLIAVANREGGYSSEQQEDLEAIAPAVIQALRRLRAEKERDQIEKALRETRDYLENLLDYANAPIIVWDSSFRITKFNHAFEQLTGLKANEAVGKPLDILFPDNGREESMRLMESALSGERWEVVEIPILHANGSVRIVLWNSANIYDRDNEKVIAIITQGQDITERKRAEEALKKANDTLEEKVVERTAELEEANTSLLENELRLNEAQKIARLGNWEWNLINDEMHWSDEIYHIFGLDPLELVPTYNEFLSRIEPEDRSYVHNAIQKALSGELYNIEYRITLPGGEKRIFHSQGEVVFDEKHIPVRMKGVIQDITERKKAEEALEKTEKIRIKEIHHRIKNNLQVISSLLDLQAEKFEDETVKVAFIEAQNRVISMSLLHEELYKGEGTITLDFSAYLKKLAENLFQTYSLQSDNICLNLDLEDNAFLDMDIAVPLGIIVNELVSNSLKHAFTEAEAGEVRIQLCRDEETSDEVQKSIFSLTISDNGKGIPKDLELENAESLGLQLVGILVDQLDGQLELNRMQGTEFRIIFGA